jgi:hypothetical protein
MSTSILDLTNFIVDVGPDAADLDARLSKKFPDASKTLTDLARRNAVEFVRKWNEQRKRMPQVHRARRPRV